MIQAVGHIISVDAHKQKLTAFYFPSQCQKRKQKHCKRIVSKTLFAQVAVDFSSCGSNHAHAGLAEAQTHV
jgi:hypothetical protein